MKVLPYCFPRFCSTFLSIFFSAGGAVEKIKTIIQILKDSKFKIQNSRFKIQNSKFKIQNSSGQIDVMPST